MRILEACFAGDRIGEESASMDFNLDFFDFVITSMSDGVLNDRLSHSD